MMSLPWASNVIVLFLSWGALLDQPFIPHIKSDSFGTGRIQTDTMVNYCSLVRAGFFYGQKSTENKSSIDRADVEYFNDLWRQILDVPSFQAGITPDEFTTVKKFREGNKQPFPPSARYNKKNPDTYLLFHIAKEVGKVKSPAYDRCPTCVTESIDKINELLKGAYVHGQVMQLWLGTTTLKKITTVGELTDFWLFLRCMFIDDRVNPLSEPMFISLPPVVRVPDTTIIKCHDEIKPKVTVGYRHCEIGGKVDTIGPQLIKGINDCPGAVYRIKFVAKDQCNKSDSAYQYFKIKNEPPDITCPSDTLLDCIENLRKVKPAATSDCNLRTKVSTSGPKLISGKHNCPYAVYEMKYTITDTCGRKETCAQKITIQNDDPTIICPPDTVVECIKYFKPGKPKYKISCRLWAEVTSSVPKLIKGKPDCDGSVYEVVYTVEDSCDRKASCTQKITIKNKGPEIECPQNVEVLCEDDIHVGLPKSVKVSCDLKYEVRTSDPVLILGTRNCTGAVYAVTFTVTDECGRTDHCDQLFTILQPELSITCPPNQKVMCADDIKASQAIIKIACKRDYKVSSSAPSIRKGIGNCPGDEYVIVYTVSDNCGFVKECVQVFTIDNPAPEIVCNPEEIINCDTDPEFIPPVPAVSCDLNYEVDVKGPELLSGKDGCDGAVYAYLFIVTDECGRTAQCTQKYKLRIPLPVVTCEPDQTVSCEQSIVSRPPKVTVECEQQYKVEAAKLRLISGNRNCAGAVYGVTYTVTDDCDRVVTCTQKFTLLGGVPKIECPPDRVVPCSKDIVDEGVVVTWGCSEGEIIFEGPVLESGIPDCPNAIYTITYFAEDSCGLSDQCVQRFRLSGDDLQVTCPPDTVVRSKADIRAAITIRMITSCNVEAGFDYTGPTLISGVDDQPGAVYEIIYTAIDDCDQRETCVQRFTIIGPPDDGLRELCDCYREIKNVSLDLLESGDDRFNKDIAALIKKYGCKKIKEWAQGNVTELYNAWATSEILGSNVGIANDIARRGNISIVLKNIENINKVIEVLEEAINGEPKKTLEKIAELIATDGMTYLTGSGTPALVFTSIKSLGEFAAYLNSEILIINLKTLANYADRDPYIFDPDHYLKEYAKIREIRPGDRITWKDIHNPFRSVIYEYAQVRLMNPNLPAITEIWNNQQNLTLIRTITYTMLKEVCQYWCYKLTLTKHVNQLIKEQSLLMRFRSIVNYLNNYDCRGDEVPCVMDHAELVEINGRFECQCVKGYKWDPGKIRCIPFTDCSLYDHSIEVYRGDSYECDCPDGYEWNAGRTACVLKIPDCPQFYPNTVAVWNNSTNEYLCDCISGHVWNATRTGCIPQAPDCTQFYPNTTAVWNDASNQWLCDCISGYTWNAAMTACIPPAPDCPQFYANTAAKWDDASNQWLCDCISGYTWNATRTACILPAPDCPQFYANTVAVWNDASNQWLCDCITGYSWNDTRTACILPVPDCPQFYANTVAVWNAASNSYLCDCISGYVWNDTRTACVSAIPDCNLYYANTKAVWNAASNQYLCDCVSGYVWNDTRTACVTPPPDCSQFYPATVAVWYAAQNQYLCDCVYGYTWNSSRTACIPIGAPECTQWYTNSYSAIDQATNQYSCYCLPGHVWNDTRTQCIPSTNRDNIVVGPQQQHQGNCNEQYRNGGDQPEQYTIDVQRTSGTLLFTYNTESIKDRIHVYYNNAKIFDTGCVGASGSQNFTLNGSSVFRIIVDSKCDPTESNTSWSFSLGCPQ